MAVGTIVGWVFLILACAGAAYALAAGILVPRFFAVRRPHPATDRAPGVTILKPLCGVAPGLGAHLATFCGQDYPGDIQIVFGVQAASDPAIAMVDEIKERF